jgi:hypothetical protein
MLLICRTAWQAPDTGSDYGVGNKYDVRDARGAELVRIAPEGTFEVIGQELPPKPRSVERPEPEAPVTTTAPDREMTGGQAREEKPRRKARSRK